MSKMNHKWRSIVSMMMAVLMTFSVFPTSFYSYAADIATDSDATSKAYVKIESELSDDVKESDADVTGIVYEIYEDAECEDLIGSFALSYDGKAYVKNDEPIFFKDSSELDNQYLQYLRLMKGTYYYRMTEKLYKSEKKVTAQHIYYDDQIHTFSLSDNNLTKEGALKLKPTIKTVEVVKTLDRIERKMGTPTFRKIFKTITVDNGCEFMDCKGMERSKRTQGKRTKIYYCHPYSSWERGSNENQNRLVRRHVPKGVDFDNKTQGNIVYIENWINTYPRRLFGYRSAEDLYNEELKNLLAV